MSLLVTIDRYLRGTGMPPTKFGRLAVNDPRVSSATCAAVGNPVASIAAEGRGVHRARGDGA